MNIRRMFVMITAVMLTSAVFADSSSVTSRKYVDDFMANYQDKIPGSGTDKLMIYDESPDGIGEKNIVSSLGSNTSASDVPNVGAVKAGMDGKQDTINGTAGYVMTGTGTAGSVGEKPIYSASAKYTDALVTAETVNTAVTNAVNSSLIRVDANGDVDPNGTLWQIADDLIAINANVPYGYTELQYIQSTGTQYIDTGIILTQDTTEIKVVSDLVINEIPSSGSNVLYRSTPNSGVQVYLYYTGVLYNQGISRSVHTGQEYLVETITTATSRSISINNGPVVSQNFSRSITDGSTLYSFGSEESTYPGAKATWKYQKIYKNGVLVRDFIPVNHTENGETIVGLYDKITGGFFASESDTGFIAGPPVSN